MKLTAGKENPMNCALYQARPKDGEFEKSENSKMLEMKLNKQAKKEWDAATRFTEKKDGSLRFCLIIGN